ncbi:MAG: alpha/beta hydrolase [Chitinophagaceae bacterium]|nr:alpha/beta hydrolase [Anaerolineae bacterium]
MSLKENTVSINGRLVHYWEDGTESAQSILLLHGGFGDAWLHWSHLFPILAKEYHIVAPDLPGYGQSELLQGMSIDSLIEWTKNLLDELDIEQAIIIGNSFGALITRLFAAHYPKYTPAIILVNGGVIPSVPTFARILAMTPGVGGLLFTRLSKSTSSRTSLQDVVHVKDILNDEFTGRVKANVQGLAHLMKAMTLSPIPENRTPRIPVLLLWGEEDTVTPLKIAEQIQGNIPNAKLVIITECGHLPHIEAPEVFVFQVTNFLRELSRLRRPEN